MKSRNSRRAWRRTRAWLIAAAAIGLAGATASADTFEWTGAAVGNNNWSDPGNWFTTTTASINGVPDDAADVVLFNNASSDAAQVIDVDGAFAISHIEMSATGNRSFALNDATGSLSLARTSFEFDGAAGSQALTFNVGVAIDTMNLNWRSASELTFNGAITSGANQRPIRGGGTVVFSQSPTGGVSVVDVSDGTLVVFDTATPTGGARFRDDGAKIGLGEDANPSGSIVFIDDTAFGEVVLYQSESMPRTLTVTNLTDSSSAPTMLVITDRNDHPTGPDAGITVAVTGATAFATSGANGHLGLTIETNSTLDIQSTGNLQQLRELHGDGTVLMNNQSAGTATTLRVLELLSPGSSGSEGSSLTVLGNNSGAANSADVFEFGNGMVYDWSIGDLLDIDAGQLALESGGSWTLSVLADPGNGTYLLARAGGGIDPLLVTNGIVTGVEFGMLFIEDNQLFLHIPEPGTLVAVGMCGLALFTRRRRPADRHGFLQHDQQHRS